MNPVDSTAPTALASPTASTASGRPQQPSVPTRPKLDPELAPDLRTPLRRWMLGLGLSVLSGLMLVWSMEGYHIEGLIFIGFVPALVAQHRVLPRRWSGLGFGIPVGILFQGYLGPGLSNADLAWYLYVYGLWIALFVAAIAWRSRGFHSRTGYRWFVLSTPLAYVAFEFVRTNMTEVFGGSWGMLPYALYERPGILQPVSITGIHGMTLLLLLINFGIARVVLTQLDERLGPPDGRAPLTRAAARRDGRVITAVTVGWVVLSLALLDNIHVDVFDPLPENTVRVAAIQPDPYDIEGIDRVLAGEIDADDISISEQEKLRRNIEQTVFAANQGAELVVWYEGGLKFDPSGPEGEPIRALADEHNIYLAVGWQSPTEGGRYNEVATFSPDGEFLGSYGKSHPGEFAGDFSARQGDYLVYDAPFGRFGSIICFDLDFLDSARNVAKLGANILAVSSNDVPGIADKHYTHLVFRSIESRLATVKADSAFDSAITDPYGRILDAYVNQYTGRATLVADVQVGSGDTFYVRFGDWFAWLALAGSLVFLGVGAQSRWGRREPS